MGSEWTPVTLGELSADVSYGYTESASQERVGPRFLRITDIQNGVVDWRTVPYCPITEKNHEKYRLHAGDIVVARTGNSTGENYLFNCNEDAVYASYLIRFKIDDKRADSRFVWYTMRSPNWWGYVNSSKTGSAQAGANAKVLGGFPILLPPLSEQRAIAHILSSLDDKIELNRKTNETLEAMAQAIFKSWFVDFDPVIDNALAAGNPIPEELQDRAAIREALGNERKSLPEDIRNLFPSEFELKEEMGWVPKGWKVGPIEDHVSIYGGATPSTKESSYWEDGQFFWATPKDLSGLQDKIIHTTERKITQLGVDTISSGQLPTGTVLLSSRAPIGYLAIAAMPVSVNQGFIAMVCDKGLPNVYILQWASAAMAEIKNRSGGSTFAEISKKNFRPIPVIVPGEQVLEKFREISESYYRGIESRVLETDRLSSLRDTLLPKLLSGKIPIPDAEKLSESAA